ncbi:hypothetical protein X753_24970 [Mesorhizobium sp. LNJC399B00]|nr:hypothetical protein X753_24970 [Mesorhizobium sp. LNJC399B00]
MTPEQIKRRDWVATYPTREAALALVEWIRADDWETVSELDRRLPGIGIEWTQCFNTAAERCFEVYGYPALDVVTIARRIAEVTTRPAAPRRVTTGASDELPGPPAPARPSARPEGAVTTTYGFTPRG